MRTPFAVRCNVVKVWRPLPAGLWELLAGPAEIAESRRRERRALLAIAIMAAMLIAGFSSVGYRTLDGEAAMCVPLLGEPIPLADGPAWAPGWHWSPVLSPWLSLWMVVPPLLGWAFVRLLWIPKAAADQPGRETRLALARHLSGVYLYVYVMIVVGAALMVPLVQVAPAGTETFRWCLRWFLFGESFFVPAAMWLRLIRNDKSGKVFGRLRYGLMATYVLVFVTMPILGMLTGPA